MEILLQIDSDMELSGATLSEGAGYLTIYSSNRAQVYRISNGERLGSTSFRVNVAYAAYSPKDQQILAFAECRSKIIKFKIRNYMPFTLGERSIARTDISFPVSFLDHSKVKIDQPVRTVLW
jgi:hypothetical protein